MPSKMLAKKKYGASKDEVDLEPASELSSDERGYVEVVETEVMEFINYYDTDKY